MSENPFEDPSVLQYDLNAQFRIEDHQYFNQFDNQQAYSQSNTEPAVMQTTLDPPAYMKSGQQVEQTMPTLSTAELQWQREELERKEQELARREEKLRQKTSYNIRRNNWPPLPERCGFQPCFYQDIEVDIPREFQKIVRQLYYLWMFHGIIMLLNIIGGIILLNFTIIGLGVLYTLLFTPFSYLCWFRPAYKAFRDDSSFNFMAFFFIFFFQFIVTFVQTIGMPESGTIGLITAFRCFHVNTTSGVLTGIFALAVTFGFAFAATADLFLILKIHRLYRGTGASFAKAQEEFTTGFLRNPEVANTAANLAAAAVHSQMAQNANRR